MSLQQKNPTAAAATDRHYGATSMSMALTSYSTRCELTLKEKKTRNTSRPAAAGVDTQCDCN